jgi:phosphatidylethanolamine/phosphatidyl-N-methylethanolamine N-methyltransferase
MSILFLKRFIQKPMQVASVVPSSKHMIRRVAGKMDLRVPRTIVEFGAGEGCHTREIHQRMHADSRLLLFELDPVLAEHLDEQFCDDARVTVLNANALALPEKLVELGHAHCDYVVSGIPFSILEGKRKRELLDKVYASLAPASHAAFIIYQVTNELRARGHCDHFARAESEYCLQNIPPMFITKFYKTANGHAHVNGTNGHKHPSIA